MDGKFFDSLFEGDSANGVKLCMGVTGGDFWARQTGCQNLYRGDSINAIDFTKLVAVVEASDVLITVPSTAQHENDSCYLYIFCRANCCGYEVLSLNAAIKIVFDSQGNLIEQGCNKIFNVIAEQIAGGKVRLQWYYNPLGQADSVVRFNIYSDDGSGNIDYENAVSTVDYKGVRFYSYQSNSLDGGRYLFCIKTESSIGKEDNFCDEIEIQISTLTPADVENLHSQII